jgi:hypothetical protein
VGNLGSAQRSRLTYGLILSAVIAVRYVRRSISLRMGRESPNDPIILETEPANAPDVCRSTFDRHHMKRGGSYIRVCLDHGSQSRQV